MVRSNMGICIAQLTLFLIFKWTGSSQGRLDWFTMVTKHTLQPVSHIQVCYKGTSLRLTFLLHN